MTIKTASVVMTGINPLLMNNPQCVDPLNVYSKEIKKITKKKVKTEDDLKVLADLEMRAKVYWVDDKICIPSTWLTAAIHAKSHKLEKISKADSRSGLFTTEDYIPLKFDGSDIVEGVEDVTMVEEYRHRMILKQGQVRICKTAPIFHNWSFETFLDYDDSVYDFDVLERIIQSAAAYGGFGDFRPTFGRAKVVVEDV